MNRNGGLPAGAQPRVLYTRFDGPLGRMLATADGNALTGLYFEGQRYGPVPAPHWRERPDLPLFVALRAQLAEYFAGRRRSFSVALAPAGTAFQRAVWTALRGLGAGTTCSYADIARAVGRPRAVRAVGAAIGRNPISVIVPCHRVLGSDGSLTGYAGGLDRKRALLERERWPAPASAPAVPA